MNVIIACESIRKELESVIQKNNCTYPVIWLGSDLHEFPNKLRGRLQETLDSIPHAENVLLCNGCCSNAVLGLIPHGFKLVFPKVDDCITLLLGSTKRRKELDRLSYFFTNGWLEGDKSILKEYADTIVQYGEESADVVYNFLLGDYNKALLVDTNVSEMKETEEKTKHFCEKFHLEQEIVSGDLHLFNKLITGEWDENFAVVSSEEVVNLTHVTL